MKNFLLIFSFVPVILMYSGNGPASSTANYVFMTLMLICIADEILSALAKHTIKESEFQIESAAMSDFCKAVERNDKVGASICLHSVNLFNGRTK